MHVNYIIISTEKKKYNVTVNKTYKYNVVIAGIFSMVIWISYKVVMVQNSSKNALCSEEHHYILLGVGKVTKVFCMALKE